MRLKLSKKRPHPLLSINPSGKTGAGPKQDIRLPFIALARLSSLSGDNHIFTAASALNGPGRKAPAHAKAVPAEEEGTASFPPGPSARPPDQMTLGPFSSGGTSFRDGTPGGESGVMHFISSGPPFSAEATRDCTDGVIVIVRWKIARRNGWIG